MAAMSEAHKEAMARGRRQARAVKNYLEALERDRRRGPKQTPAKVQRRIEETTVAIDQESSPVKRLELIQSRMDDEDLLHELEQRVDIDELEDAFVEIVADYSDRKGISYMAWRELKVPAKVLKRAGMRQGD